MVAPSPSFLIIQTAFIGDVVLATALVEKLHQQFPASAIDFLLRKGNDDLLKGHPFLRKVIVWDKKKRKLRNLFKIMRQVRASRYDYVINIHRFTSSGLITFFSAAKTTIGFDKNPLSFFFTRRFKHLIGNGLHEVERNQSLIEELTDRRPSQPRLYPSKADQDQVAAYQSHPGATRYICVAPTSVWFTKQYPKEKWLEFIDQPETRLFHVYLLGAPQDHASCELIRQQSKHPAVINLAGKLSLLESAALMQKALMNFVNDSAPLHLASAVNARVTAVFCSTVPAFGFGPLSDKSFVVETTEKLSCRPCGLHGFRACPQGHFKCALSISKEQLAVAIKGLI